MAIRASDTVTACVLIIGNEVLSGRTQDANLQYLGAGLGELGIRLIEARVIADDEDTIARVVNECRARYDYVFTTGGIGPTHDDITAAAVARAFGVALIRNPQAVALLEDHYAPNKVNEARLKMAETPDGARLVENPVSSAPGFQMGNVFVLAGVPSIMRVMFDGLKDRLEGGRPMLSETIVARLPEGIMAEGLAAAQARHPSVEIGSYPFFREGRMGVSLVVRATDAGAITAAIADVGAEIRRLGGKPSDEDDAP
ncbi:MAG: molybdopterin-binding protein [Rhodospirillales bacterium]|jgi:molybdenum cofactor synthesis domain-containing protein|nr:molybdopterin-binding protein [Rhodospirillales bacterium]MDP6804706.1 molybdopterin-binding protein [Rhodospirillales bacterium]